MKIRTLVAGSLCALGVTLLTPTTAQAALIITPADCVVGTCWTTNDNSNLTIAEIEALVDATDLESFYKSNVGGGGEDGSFAGSYTTTYFNTPSDPADADIVYDGAPDPAISCPTCYLLVKDGNQEPAQYIFLINSWDGMETIQLRDFWPAQGAISHIEILGKDGNGGGDPIPEPATLALFGLGLLGAGIARRRR